ncbi:MAG TPA: DUF4291 domain-containing protein [Planctomycetes bacterium]|nr:DUF4291 domain-containing protein [Planctomycetota bacterium]
MSHVPTPQRQIRARYDERTIRVYQAYNDAIAEAALAAQTFVAPFSRTRMTWIKPSFLWMMYRSGWGQKDPGQRRVLGIDLTREGFEWALRHASLSHGDQVDTSKPVRVQWDPERDIDLARLEHRSIQIGLKDEAVRRYVDEWIVGVEEVTELAHEVQATRDPALLPEERPYPVPSDIALLLGM